MARGFVCDRAQHASAWRMCAARSPSWSCEVRTFTISVRVAVSKLSWAEAANEGIVCTQNLPRSSGCVTQAAMLLALPPNQNGYRTAGGFFFLRSSTLAATATSGLLVVAAAVVVVGAEAEAEAGAAEEAAMGFRLDFD